MEFIDYKMMDFIQFLCWFFVFISTLFVIVVLLDWVFYREMKRMPNKYKHALEQHQIFIETVPSDYFYFPKWVMYKLNGDFLDVHIVMTSQQIADHLQKMLYESSDDGTIGVRTSYFSYIVEKLDKKKVNIKRW